jgi:hypothetical protein
MIDAQANRKVIGLERPSVAEITEVLLQQRGRAGEQAPRA